MVWAKESAPGRLDQPGAVYVCNVFAVAGEFLYSNPGRSPPCGPTEAYQP